MEHVCAVWGQISFTRTSGINADSLTWGLLTVNTLIPNSLHPPVATTMSETSSEEERQDFKATILPMLRDAIKVELSTIPVRRLSRLKQYHSCVTLNVAVSLLDI